MSSSKSKASAGSESAARSPGDTSMWLQRVHDAQTSRLPPERREELKRRAEQSRLREQQTRKCKAISKNAMRSNLLVHEGLRQMASSARPEAYSEAAGRWRSAQDASEARQARRINKVEASRNVTDEAQSSASSDSEEAIEEMAQLVGAPDASAMRAAEASLSAAPSGARRASSGIEELLAQVRTEPAESSECAAKFSLYEGYSEQLEKIRKLLFEFYEESVSTVPPNVGGEWKRQLKKIDSAEAMSVPDDDGRIWFVYHMMRTAEKNNRGMTGVLEDFQRKIELLAKDDQTECPVCLDPFTEPGGERPPETLSCCHKICEECWEQWKRVTHGHPFCPLCKNEDFLGVVAASATAG